MKSRWQISSGHFISHAGSAVVAQGLLSAANFVVGLLLLRGAGAQPYAHYVLAMNSVALAVSLQTAFLGPPLSTRLPSLVDADRAALVGGLLAEQQRLLWRVGGAAAAAIVLFFCYIAIWPVTAFSSRFASISIANPQHHLATALVLASSFAAMVYALQREFLRQTLLALRRAHDILRADLLYAAMAVAGVLVARQTTDWLAPSVVLLALAGGAVHSRRLLNRSLRQQLLPAEGRKNGLLQEIVPLAIWSTSGAGLFWLYTQGFLYLVAATLGTTAVAALAATRLMLMPMNLLSSGLGGLLAPAAAGWLKEIGRARLLRRLSGIALAISSVTVLWVGLLYAFRQPLFALLFKQPLAHAEALLLAWGAVYVSMALRDQVGYLLTALGMYRQLTLLTALATVCSLSGCLGGMWWIPDVRGAMVGLLVGETVTLLGVLALVLRAVHQTPGLTPDGIVSPA